MPKRCQQVAFTFDPENVADPNVVSPDAARLMWMFVTLLRRRDVTYREYAKSFLFSEKTFGRDVAKLRELGRVHGFTLRVKERGHVVLVAASDLASPRSSASAGAADALRAVFDAFGAVVANEIGAVVETGAARPDPFLGFATPNLLADGAVADTYRAVRDAWTAKARVRFRYPRSGARESTGQAEERLVEPHMITYYDGRYYLVAYDRRPKTLNWRQFALDRIIGPISTVGTFAARAVPAHYRGEDSIGLFKTGSAVDVTIEVAPSIAKAVCARRWQRVQRVAPGNGDWTALTFTVYDVGEAVRWAFRFGAFARIVAPAHAVEAARSMLSAMLADLDERAQPRLMA